MREGRYVWGAPVGFSNGATHNGKPTIAPNEMASATASEREVTLRRCMAR